MSGQPTLTIPAVLVLQAAQTFAISGVGLTEPGVVGDTYTVYLSDSSGLLSASGGGITGSGTDALTITGSLASVQADLATLKELESATGKDTIRISAIDGQGAVASGSIAVTVLGAAPLPPPPTLTASSTLDFKAGNTASIRGVQVLQADASAGELLAVTLTDSIGLLSATGAGVSGAGTDRLLISGSLAQVNADLATLTDADDTRAGNDTIEISTTDGAGRTATAAISVKVTSPATPEITAGFGTVTGAGGTLALINLGSLPLAETWPLSIGLADDAVAGADSLSGTVFEIENGAKISIASFAGLGAGDNTLLINSDLNAATIGSVTETFVLELTDSATGVLPDRTVKVEAYMTSLPTITAPTALDITVGSTAAITGLSLSELAAFTGENFTLTLSDTNGLLSATGAGVSGAGTDMLTITGTLAQVNADLATLKDTDPIAVSDKIKIFAIDSKSEYSRTDTITVTPVGTASGLTLSAPGTLLYAGVGLTTAIDGVSISAPAATAGEIFTVELTDTHNKLAATGPGVTGSGTPMLIISGTLGQVNADLATLEDLVSGGLRDDITVAAADASGGIAVSTIDVFGANLEISVPSGLVLGAGIASALEIDVLDLSDTPYDTVTISDVKGLLSLVGDDLVTISGNDTNHLVISGLDENVSNAIADDLMDTEPASGTDTVSIRGIDGLGVTATSTFAVTVNGPPVLTAPTSLALMPETTTALTGIRLSETGDTTHAYVTINVQDDSGLFSLPSGIENQYPITFIYGNGSSDIEINTPLSAANAILAALTDIEFDTGVDTIVISGSDDLGGSFAETIGVTTNSALFPTLTAPATLVLGAGDTASVPGLSLAIATLYAGETFSITLRDAHGLLSATGPGVSGTGTDRLTISGSLAQVNRALATVIDADAVPGSELISIEVGSNYAASVGDGIIDVTATELLTLSSPGSVQLGISGSASIGQLSISDAGLTAGERFAVTLSDSDAEIYANDSAGNGVSELDGAVVISGSEAQVNADLATVYLVDDSRGTGAVSLAVTDSHGDSVRSTIAVVPQGPLVLAAPGPAEIEQGLAAPIAVTLSETGYIQGETFTVIVADNTGLLSATGTGVTGVGTERVTIAGTLAAVNAALATLTDTEPNSGSDVIAISASQIASGQVTAASVDLTVKPSPTSVTLATHTTLDFAAGSTAAVTVKVSEGSTVAGEMLTITVSDAYGLFSAAGTGITGAGTDALTISGSLAQVNAELATLTDSDATVGGNDTITVAANNSLGYRTSSTIAVDVSSPAAPEFTATGGTLTKAGTTLALLNLGTLAAGGEDKFTIGIANDAIPGSDALFGDLYEIEAGKLVDIGNFVEYPVDAGSSGDLTQVNFFGDTAGLSTETFVLWPMDGHTGPMPDRTLIAEAYVTSKPTITAPSSLTLAASETIALSGISLSEAAGAVGETYTIRLSDSDGLFFDSGAGVSGSGSNRLTITGTLAQVNADLTALLKIEETAAGSDIITLTASDSLGNKATTSVAVTVAASHDVASGASVGSQDQVIIIDPTTGSAPTMDFLVPAASVGTIAMAAILDASDRAFTTPFPAATKNLATIETPGTAASVGANLTVLNLHNNILPLINTLAAHGG